MKTKYLLDNDNALHHIGGYDATRYQERRPAGRQRQNDQQPRLEKEVRVRIRRPPAQFNLPSKKDVDGLARRVGALNKKVDTLHRAVAA